MNEEQKKKIAQAQRKRWQKLKEDGKAANTVRDNLSQAMRDFWASKSREERLLRAKKAAETRRKNQQAKRGKS